MFKRMFLTCTFIAAIGAAGLGVTSTATAWDDCAGGYRTAYYPTAYPAYYGYAPSVAYYRQPLVVRNYGYYDGRYDDHHHRHHDRDHNFVSFSFGF